MIKISDNKDLEIYKFGKSQKEEIDNYLHQRGSNKPSNFCFKGKGDESIIIIFDKKGRYFDKSLLIAIVDQYYNILHAYYENNETLNKKDFKFLFLTLSFGEEIEKQNKNEKNYSSKR